MAGDGFRVTKGLGIELLLGDGLAMFVYRMMW